MENKPASPEFDRFAHQYTESLDDPLRRLFTPGGSYFHQRKLDLLLAGLRERRRSPERMAWIDVGCGQGDLLKMGRTAFASAAGCDISGEMLAHCGDLPVAKQTEPCRLPFADASADLITAVCIFHHVEERDRLPLAQDIVRVLKPNGLLVVIEHNPWNPATQWIVRRSPVDATARLLFPRTSLRLLRRSGLELDGRDYFLYLPEKLYARFGAMESALRKLPLGGQYMAMGRKAV